MVCRTFSMCDVVVYPGCVRVSRSGERRRPTLESHLLKPVCVPMTCSKLSQNKYGCSIPSLLHLTYGAGCPATSTCLMWHEICPYNLCAREMLKRRDAPATPILQQLLQNYPLIRTILLSYIYHILCSFHDTNCTFLRSWFIMMDPDGTMLWCVIGPTCRQFVTAKPKSTLRETLQELVLVDENNMKFYTSNSESCWTETSLDLCIGDLSAFGTKFVKYTVHKNVEPLNNKKNLHQCLMS